MKDLRELLIDYKAITESIISTVSNEDYEGIESLLDSRQAVIGAIQQLKYTKDDFNRIENELNIHGLQEKLDMLMNEKMNLVRSEIKKTKVNQNVNKNYNFSGYTDSIFFNKKI